MANQKPVSSDPGENLGILAEIVKRLRLVWLLFRDKRVPLWIKAVLPMSLLYLLSPIDFIPDVFVGLGQLDDLSVILLAMALFVKLSPPDIVDYYLHRLEYGADLDHTDEVVDTTYRVIDED